MPVIPRSPEFDKKKASTIQASSYVDNDFWQEYHEPYPVGSTPEQNNVRSLTVDKNNDVWIATAEGVSVKRAGKKEWLLLPFNEEDKGPAYSVSFDDKSVVWMGTWKGVFSFANGIVKKYAGTTGPISGVRSSPEGVYALGPKGCWLFEGSDFIEKDYAIARSIRDVVPDGKMGLWVATDVGLYHSNAQGTKKYRDTSVLLSAGLKGLAFDAAGNLWVAGLGGVTILKNNKKERVIRPQEGCLSIHVTVVKRSPDNVMWVGTELGLSRFEASGKKSVRFSRRWLLDDQVNDISFDAAGNAWIATAKGVSAIKKKKMNLNSKQNYFYEVLMERHIRKPWIAGQNHLVIRGDINSWTPEDDDNDGEFGGNYLAMESFRYATTKSEDAKEKAGKAFAFLKQLREITGGDGYFARTMVPAEWKEKVHDGNRTYSAKQQAEELVNEPRFKPVETRWHTSKDGQWFWKGDASSDEWCGHMFGYFFYYQLAADQAGRVEVRNHVATLVDHLMANDYNMMDVDGTHTRWSVWSPSLLNGDPEWASDQSMNSMELLAFLKLAYFMTGNIKYERAYKRMIEKEHYLENMARLTDQNPSWFIYYDVMMQSYLYPILIHCETDPALKAWYQDHMDNWMKKRVNDHNPQINFTYCYARNKKQELKASIDFLVDTPLDLVSWVIDHTKREDIKLVHSPVLDEVQVDKQQPASMRATVRWDTNPWVSVNGNPAVEREPVFWLLPYWMGRYLGMILSPQSREDTK